jgi:hypothetical protein
MKLDWLLYAAALTTIVVVTGNWHETSNSPPAPPPPGIGEMSLFANFTPFTISSIINLPVDDQKIMTGTAFSISKSGEWIVAKDSVGDCTHPFLNIGGNLAVPFKTRPAPGHDNFLVAVTSGGGRPLSLVDMANVKPGMRGFMIGYPGGSVGEATGRLIGRATLERSKRFQRNEAVLAWAKAGQTEGLKGDLNQLQGGPAVDDNSHVVGITLRENPRRGRIYTTVPETVSAIASTVERKPDFDAENTLTKRNYGIVSDTLRREYRVAQVGCIIS